MPKYLTNPLITFVLGILVVAALVGVFALGRRSADSDSIMGIAIAATLVPIETFTPTSTPTSSSTPSPSATETNSSTATVTETSSPTSTQTSTVTPTSTKTLVPTKTPIPTATPVPGLSDADAVNQVHARHTTLFGLMGAMHLAIYADGRDAYGNVTVVVSWSWNGKQRFGHYLVDPQGTVSPLDSSAQTIDAAAKYGPLALKFLA